MKIHHLHSILLLAATCSTSTEAFSFNRKHNQQQINDVMGTNALALVQNIASAVPGAARESRLTSTITSDERINGSSGKEPNKALVRDDDPIMSSEIAKVSTMYVSDSSSSSIAPEMEEEEKGGVFSRAKHQIQKFNNSNNQNNDKTYGGAMYEGTNKEKNTNIVLTALAKLEKDMSFLDNLTGERSQLTPFELFLFACTVSTAAISPLLPGHLYEFVAPSAAAFGAAIGISAEYAGKVAVADGKEVAAITIQCAAEAEAFLANAERVKAVLPLCVGVSASAASFALLAPVIVSSLKIESLQLITQLYLFCPLVSILNASIASLALEETRGFASRAISVGNRRFAQKGLVGRTWLSQTEQIERNSQRTRIRWNSFAASVLPAPLIGAICPGSLASKAIIVAALAAMQTAYFLAQAEFTLARASDAVALKARSAAVADTYANQGARNGAILPFTSALSALSAAATAAVVELPIPTFLGDNIIFLSFLYGAFPTFGALFGAAASVSKARCEVDAEAATQAAATLALEYDSSTVDPDDDDDGDLVLRPLRKIYELIRLSSNSFWRSIKSNKRTSRIAHVLTRIIRSIFNSDGNSNDPSFQTI